MTRYVYRALGELDRASANLDTRRLFAYHHATKHSYDSVRAGAHFLDWRNQPDPFRVYQGTPLVPLPSPGKIPSGGVFQTIGALERKSGERPAAPALDLALLAGLLWHSVAISAWKRVPGSNFRYSLRVNPSSGNLHPTETHLAVRGFDGVEDGLYHYRVDAHALEQRGRGAWVARLAGALRLPRASSAPLIVALTSVFWREA